MAAFLGLGSNLGDRWAYVRAGVTMLAEADPELVVSPVYQTDPVGGPAGQGPYLNCVVRLVTALLPLELLALAHRAEAQAGRVRTVPFGPRTLDVDVLVIDGFTSDEEALVVPHPRIGERPFVLAPMEDLDPSRVPADWRARLGTGGIRKVGALIAPFGPVAPHRPGAGR